MIHPQKGAPCAAECAPRAREHQPGGVWRPMWPVVGTHHQTHSLSRGHSHRELRAVQNFPPKHSLWPTQQTCPAGAWRHSCSWGSRGGRHISPSAPVSLSDGGYTLTFKLKTSRNAALVKWILTTCRWEGNPQTLSNVTTPAYKHTLKKLDSTKPTDKTHIQVLRYLWTLMSCRLMIPYDDPKPLERHMFL